MAWPVAAQIRVGDLSTSVSGTVSTGYTADYGNATSSDHSWAVGGDAALTGSFYNPNFLNFNAAFYLNQSRANSDFQSISNASGLNVAANIFGGSRFPGSISYSKSFDSEGNYAIPGLANYVTHGNSDTFGVNWSESLPDAPIFRLAFRWATASIRCTERTIPGATHSMHSISIHPIERRASTWAPTIRWEMATR